MTDERNFDRLARAWLDLMPDEAPDRTIAAVLQAVETAPQARPPFRWLTRRFPNMNRLSMVAALAAATVLAVGGGLWLTRSDGSKHRRAVAVTGAQRLIECRAAERRAQPGGTAVHVARRGRGGAGPAGWTGPVVPADRAVDSAPCHLPASVPPVGHHGWRSGRASPRRSQRDGRLHAGRCRALRLDAVAEGHAAPAHRNGGGMRGSPRRVRGRRGSDLPAGTRTTIASAIWRPARTSRSSSGRGWTRASRGPPTTGRSRTPCPDGWSNTYDFPDGYVLMRSADYATATEAVDGTKDLVEVYARPGGGGPERRLRPGTESQAWAGRSRSSSPMSPSIRS